MTRQIDADAVEGEKLPVVVLGEFADLGDDESIHLTASRAPRDALTALQLQHPGTFEWIVLESGPARFRIEIRRRPRGGELTIRDFLDADHVRLDAMATEIAELVEGPAREGIGMRIDELICGLERHFAQEENVLFAAIERVAGGAAQHLAVLREEHRIIRGLMKGLRDAVAVQRDVGTATAALRLELRRHARKELWILYPLLDEIAGSSRKDLVRAMEET